MVAMKHFINILVLFVNISYVMSGCDISMEDVDKCGMATGVFGNRDVVIPTTEAEVEGHCATIKKNLGCVKTFIGQCLSGTVKDTAEIIINNGAKHLDRRCDNSKDRQEFLTHISCLATKEHQAPFHLCADRNIVMMEKILNMHGDDAVAAGCCVFHNFQACIRKANQDVCGEATTDYWDEVINEIAEDSMSLTCTGYETHDKCQSALDPKIMGEINAVNAITDPAALAAQHTHKSGVALMIDFLKKLSSKK